MDWQTKETTPRGGAIVLLQFHPDRPFTCNSEDWPVVIAKMHDDWYEILGSQSAWAYPIDDDVIGWAPAL